MLTRQDREDIKAIVMGFATRISELPEIEALHDGDYITVVQREYDKTYSKKASINSLLDLIKLSYPDQNGAKYQGIAHPTDTVVAPIGTDGFWIAIDPGVYTGYNNIIVSDVPKVIYYNVTTGEWSEDSLWGDVNGTARLPVHNIAGSNLVATNKFALVENRSYYIEAACLPVNSLGTIILNEYDRNGTLIASTRGVNKATIISSVGAYSGEFILEPSLLVPIDANNSEVLITASLRSLAEAIYRYFAIFDSISQRITSLEDEFAEGGRVTVAESSLVQQANLIATKVSQSTYDENNQLISQQFSNVEQRAGRIAASVEEVNNSLNGYKTTDKANFEILATAIVGTVSSFAYDENGVLTNSTKSIIEQQAYNIRLDVIDESLGANGSINNALLNTGINITSGKITVTSNQFILRNQHGTRGLTLTTDGNGDPLIDISNLKVSDVFRTTAWSTEKGDLKDYADTVSGNATNNAVNTAETYFNNIVYGQGGTAQNPTSGSVLYAIKTLNDDLSSLDTTITGAGGLASRIQDAEEGLSDLGYLAEALFDGNIVTAGGLLLGSLIQLGSKHSGNTDVAIDSTVTQATWKVWSGLNGVYAASAYGGGIAAWYGGAMLDRYYSGNTDANRAAKTLFRFDGSGYLASNKIKWDALGNLTIDGYVLTSEIQLRDTNNNVKAGISGAYNANDYGYGIAAWYGGPKVDKFATTPTPSSYAKTLFRMDGSGYLAGGELRWGANGELIIQGASSANPVTLRDVQLTDGTDTITIANLVSLLEMRSWFRTTTVGNVTYLELITSNTGIRGFVTNGFISSGGYSGGGSPSDKRLKDNISSFKYSPELLMSLMPREWDWNKLSNMQGHASGFVAQEIMQLIPYAVGTIKNSNHNEHLTLDYNMFHALEVAGLQDHEIRIIELEKAVKARDEKIAELEKRLRS